jgi:uncharacterized membrane protein
LDTYSLLKFVHVLGFLMMGGGLLGVFISEWRAFATNNLYVFTEAARYTVILRFSLVVPGALVVLISGTILIFHLDLGFFEEPWLVGMWGLLIIEGFEGNTLTRKHILHSRRLANQAFEAGALSEEVRSRARGPLSIFTHFLDLPIFIVIVYCGVAKPETWTEVVIATVISFAVAAALSMTIPRLHQRAGAVSGDPSGPASRGESP